MSKKRKKGSFWCGGLNIFLISGYPNNIEKAEKLRYQTKEK